MNRLFRNHYMYMFLRMLSYIFELKVNFCTVLEALKNKNNGANIGSTAPADITPTRRRKTIPLPSFVSSTTQNHLQTSKISFLWQKGKIFIKFLLRTETKSHTKFLRPKHQKIRSEIPYKLSWEKHTLILIHNYL